MVVELGKHGWECTVLRIGYERRIASLFSPFRQQLDRVNLPGLWSAVIFPGRRCSGSGVRRPSFALIVSLPFRRERLGWRLECERRAPSLAGGRLQPTPPQVRQ